MRIHKTSSFVALSNFGSSTTPGGKRACEFKRLCKDELPPPFCGQAALSQPWRMYQVFPAVEGKLTGMALHAPTHSNGDMKGFLGSLMEHWFPLTLRPAPSPSPLTPWLASCWAPPSRGCMQGNYEWGSSCSVVDLLWHMAKVDAKSEGVAPTAMEMI